ncbi:hypothetical protein PAESOLCIP111_04248 [Paenibacillus solanacearum]|uniref:Uncharacterized protein n=1 Tax=Paenibacillus solanacearum TaxID=2048548 RepID=A0A916K3Z1_9BACL|nr:hypothetical protein [Paenibacillus solanacearum]CAG7641588.1 hypothetical protein PAESOLCIP111_04248 [Paenibacillus solanacearum]
MHNSWVRLTMFYFAVTAVTGVVMRSAAYVPLPEGIVYGHLVHAHSHLAFLGWVYMALFVLFMVHFLHDTARNSVQLKVLFALTQLAIAGMFVSFSLQGYAIFSIGFSTLHIVLSYGFAIFVWKSLRRQAGGNARSPLSYMFVKGSLVCLAVSSIGPWMLAVLSANHLSGTDGADAAIYFYLHFQYNGWFTLGLLAVLLRILETRNVRYPERVVKLFYRMYVWSLPPSFLVSVLWIKTDPVWYAAAGIGAVLQWAAIVLLLAILNRLRASFASLFRGWGSINFHLAFAALLLKASMEVGAVVPGLTAWIFESRSIVIGYLHLVLLGFVSMLCLSFFLQLGWLDDRGKVQRAGYALFLGGFMLNELLLFMQGLFEWMHTSGLASQGIGLCAASIGMAAGVIMISVKGTAGAGASHENCSRTKTL